MGFLWSEIKNTLIQTRPWKSISFNQVVEAIEAWNVLYDWANDSPKYPNQRMMIIAFEWYTYKVPYEENDWDVKFYTAYPYGKYLHLLSK